MSTVTLARNAMATRFELVLCGDSPVALRAAGEEALAEVDRLEAQLSLFRPTSEIAHLNVRAAHESVRISPEVFALLQWAQRLTEETGGAFDITVAPLMRCWGFRAERGRVPTQDEIAEARTRVGMHLVHLDASSSSVRFEREGVALDLGAIGKGYAIERGLALLRDAGITSALFHGGTSTVAALGRPPGTETWKIAIMDPQKRTSPEKSLAMIVPGSFGQEKGASVDDPSFQRDHSDIDEPFATIPLQDEALSVSAIWGRCFEVEGRKYGHIIDPRSGQPVGGALLSSVVLPSATETDALSTALLTIGPEGHDQIAGLRPGIRTLVAGERNLQLRVEGQGIAFRPRG